MTDTAPVGQPALRKDAARNRRQIIDAARQLMADGKPVALNAVAQAADVGVGTVYRHFATPESLLEALAAEQFTALIDHAEQAAGAADGPHALRAFLRTALTAYVQDDAFAAAAIDPHPTTAAVRELRQRLQGRLGDLVTRVADDGGLHPALDAADVLLLICGVGFAVRHAAGDDPGRPDRYLDALLDGVFTAPADDRGTAA